MKNITFTQRTKTGEIINHNFKINERFLNKRKQRDGNYTIEFSENGKLKIFNNCYDIELKE